MVLTRPHAEAGAWAQALSGAGHEVLRLPLIDIVPLAHGLEVRRLARYDAVMWVSASAVRAWAGGTMVDWPPQVRCWAPGPGTARALIACGVPESLVDQPPADAPQFDSEALWPVVVAQVGAQRRLLVVRGRSVGGGAGAAHAGTNGRDWLMRQCLAAGMVVETEAAYERRCPHWSAHMLDDAMRAASDGSVWLFSSAEAVVNLGSLLPRQRWATTPALATHPRIAQALAMAGFCRVGVCRPTPLAVLDTLAGWPGA